MNIKEARNKLTEISRSTGTKHVKVLIGELCDVCQFLLDEIDSMRDNSVVTRSKMDPHEPIHIPPRDSIPLIPCQPPWPDKPKDIPIRPLPIMKIVKARIVRDDSALDIPDNRRDTE